jgi:hypothetical protein
MTKITQLDTEIIIAIAIIAVGGVKVTYAGIAPGARFLVSDALKEPHSSQKRHATRMPTHKFITLRDRPSNSP